MITFSFLRWMFIVVIMYLVLTGIIWLLVSIPSYLERKKLKKFLDQLEIGEEYLYKAPVLDPFDEDRNKEELVKILDIKKNELGDSWVKFQYRGNVRTMNIKSFKKYVEL